MKSLYNKKSGFTFFLAFAICMMGKAQTLTVYFDLDACIALNHGSNQVLNKQGKYSLSCLCFMHQKKGGPTDLLLAVHPAGHTQIINLFTKQTS